MNHAFGRRAVTTAVTLAAAAGTLLAVGTTASAAANPPAGHAVVSHTADAAPHADRRTERNDHGGVADLSERSRYDRRHDGNEYRGDHRGDRRFEGPRHREREARVWYSSKHGHHHHYDGHRLYRWDHGMWIVVISDSHGFDGSVFR
ncbi:hypothetical protein JK361_39995 [Streptomyces sp. 5-8]|uniref:Uncharacterized protein n=1 Tax=Streptomyces musisoli TaxID=2802280 RepID=A0ABS1PE52_9ACTN|nr:hypothetical protein [Streptomyces musisoli]MBL1110652.1 hypothetical protein [Streptomyces musisoli]